MDERELVNILSQDALLRAFKVYGVEGTEQKIKELYINSPKLMECQLRNYKFLLGK